MNQPPWTDTGRLQSDISDIRNELRGKANGYEIHAVSSRVDTLEHTCREIGTKVDGFHFELQALQENLLRISALIEELNN